ncbi:MAG: RHS repeat-associated core domain-containing protein [Nitrospirota bacterium]
MRLPHNRRSLCKRRRHYTANTNKLASANGKSYGYDNNGNTTEEAARAFTYNDNQRLIRVVGAGVTKGEYTYNGNDQRVKKIANSVTTIFHYNQAGLIIAESNSSGTITAEYIYLNDQPLAKIEGTNTYYYHNDHLDTPQKMTNSAKTVVWAGDYKPFGETTITLSTITNNLRFPGQYFDAETGLNYNYYRDYNPVIGRYMEADPIGLRGGINIYDYVQANPINGFDLLGKCPEIAILGVNRWSGSGNVTDKNGKLIYVKYGEWEQRYTLKLVGQSGKCGCKEKNIRCIYDVYEENSKRFGKQYPGKDIEWGQWITSPIYLSGKFETGWDCENDQFTEPHNYKRTSYN